MMSGKESIFKASSRANVQVKSVNINNESNEAVIYEDHRTFLNVLHDVREIRSFNDSVNIYLFDRHDDFCDISNSCKPKIQEYHKSPTRELLGEIVEFGLSSRDDDWIQAGMELGFINNVFLFNARESSILDVKEFKTEKYGTKRIYKVSDVWDALGHRGKFNDPIKYGESQLIKDFGFDFRDHKYHFNPKKRFILDIDLDCFSITLLDKTMAIPPGILDSKLLEIYINPYHLFYTSKFFIQHLIKESEYTSICLESGCCGGIRESQKIFNYVDYTFFDGQLGE